MSAAPSNPAPIAAATATVLPFPQTERALQIREEGCGGMGLVALLLMEREGEEDAPANVERFDGLDDVAPVTPSPELLLALLLWSALPPKKRESIRSAVRCAAFGERANTSAVQLHKMLSGKH